MIIINIINQDVMKRINSTLRVSNILFFQNLLFRKSSI